MDEGVQTGGGDGRGDGYSDRSAELLRGVEQSRCHSCVAFGDSCEATYRYWDEGEGGAHAGDEERPGQVVPEVSVDRDLGGPHDAAADEVHAESHDEPG